MYAKNTILHILSGKSYDRALRASLLFLAALNIIIIAEAFNILLQQPSNGNANEAKPETTFPIHNPDDTSAEDTELLKLA